MKSMWQLLCLVGHFLHLHKQGLHTIYHPLDLNKMHSPSPLFVPGSESKSKRRSSGVTSLSGLVVSSLSWPSCLVIERTSSELLASSLTYSSDSVQETVIILQSNQTGSISFSNA